MMFFGPSNAGRGPSGPLGFRAHKRARLRSQPLNLSSETSAFFS